MKKLVLCIWIFVVPFYVASASNISMVTYFPTPYMAYHDLDVEKACSLGLISKCELKTTNLNVVDTLTLKTGILDLKGGNIVTPKFTFGNENITGSVDGIVTFKKNLTIDKTDTTLTNIKTTSLATISSSLQLGNYAFPTCDSSDHKISWQDLTLDGTSGQFLVCGAGTDAYQTCTLEPSYEDATFQTYDGNSRKMHAGLYDMSGSCDISAVISKVKELTGVTRSCSYNGENNNSLSGLQSLYLNCPAEAEEYYSSSDEYESFSCVFAHEINIEADAYGNLLCTAGVMTCNLKGAATWQCLTTQTCGTTKDSCL